MFQAPADQEPPQPDIKDVPWRELTKPAKPEGDSQDDVLQSFLDDVKEDPPGQSGQSREGLPGSPRLNTSRASMLGLVTKVNFQEGDAVEFLERNRRSVVCCQCPKQPSSILSQPSQATCVHTWSTSTSTETW